MSEQQPKKRTFSSLFKKDSSRSNSPTPSSPQVTLANEGEDSGPRGPRRKLFTQLSEAEKSNRRSTLGTATLSQFPTNAPTSSSPSSSSANIIVPASTANQKGVLFSSTAATQPAPELETPFAKLVRTSATVASGSHTINNPSIGSSGTGTSRSGSLGTSMEVSNLDGPTTRKSNLSVEEKKNRRKSLLAPVQNLFASLGDSGKKDTSNDSGNSEDGKRRTGLFGKKEKLDFQTALALDDTQAKAQKERQKKLQKELDKIEKEKSKQEKQRQTRLLEVLTQTLELGEARATLPLPPHRIAMAMPMRPAVLSKV